MNKNMNVEVDDDIMMDASGGLRVRDTGMQGFEVGDTVRFRAVDESGRQEIRIGQIIEVAASDDGQSRSYTVDNYDRPITENNLKAV
ncbi:MAG: hypothetical protein K6G27_07085 [Lachnospiraceae bacterium]|jgi:hypothetical protein|nr:hypothetical protein [Lachnospiraceae bacterium]